MKDIPIEVLWYGKNELLPKSTVLKAGKLELTYESGIIRNIKLGDHEVVRMIYVSVRDHNWATVIPTIRNEQIEEKEGGFTISYQSLFNQDDIQIDFKVRISGTDENTIVFDIEGEALSDFQTNRTGFCLLHPIKECIGKTGEVVSPDGKIESFFFQS